MLRLRRPQHEARIEIMPMIDVIFLLLTFFIYAMVLMVRAELLPLQMPSFESGEPANVPAAVTISIDGEGVVYVDREEIALDDVLQRVLEVVTNSPDTVVYVAAEAEGSLDRLPTFLGLYDKLSQSGLDIRLVGSPAPSPEP